MRERCSRRPLTLCTSRCQRLQSQSSQDLAFGVNAWPTSRNLQFLQHHHHDWCQVFVVAYKGGNQGCYHLSGRCPLRVHHVSEVPRSLQ